ncbi:HSP20-like chaperone [Pseudoneurospora amorphoporcata]|uniref:HSP20-like chaperone n=1 Tax=Pseudoneurospora amorphoporcata TaxID=241081 RepID=A0AAN6SCW0_9PEZI|nr:HSP20-like chaperone [Pseudoneurospora amorphoporcata]
MAEKLTHMTNIKLPRWCYNEQMTTIIRIPCNTSTDDRKLKDLGRPIQPFCHFLLLFHPRPHRTMRIFPTTSVLFRITKPTASATRPHHLPRSIAHPQTRPISTTMSLFHPRSLSHPSSSLPVGTQPTFSSLFRMLDDFDKYAQQAGNIGSSLIPSASSSMETFNPKFDVTEEDNMYTLQGELPGVDPKNVDIEFTDPQTLVISGHSERSHTEGDPSLRIESSTESKKIESSESKDKSSKQSKDETESSSEKSSTPRYWLSERSYGEFSRVFHFPNSVDQDHVNAKFDHGILDIKVPKAEKKGSRKISIQG